MKDLPSMIFSSDGHLISENMMLQRMPKYHSADELYNAFLSSMVKSDADAFPVFCASRNSGIRIYPLIGFYPYHFAIAEKIIIGDDIRNIVFVAEDSDRANNLMSHVSESLRDIANRLIRDHTRFSSGCESVMYPTPESILAITHTEDFEHLLTEKNRNPVYCDLKKILTCFSKSFSENDHFPDIRFEFSDCCAENVIVEFSLSPLVYVLCALFTLMYALSENKIIELSLKKFAYAGEISLRSKTEMSDRLHSSESNLSDPLREFPSLLSVTRSVDIISASSNLIVSAYVDRENSLFSATVGVGFDYQSEPDFKFSDPYAEIEALVKNAIRIIESIN